MLKYIILRERTGEESARFALAPTKHLDMALEAQAHRPGRTIVAAGFVEFTGSEARTYGHSESLNIGTRSEDAAFLSIFAKQTALCAETSINAMAGVASSFRP